MELLSDYALSNTSLSNSHDSKHSSTSSNPRYVVSPFVHSGSFFTTDFSIEGDLITQLDRRLSTLSMRRQQILVSQFGDQEMAEKNEKITEDEHQEKQPDEMSGSKNDVSRSEDTLKSNIDYEQDDQGTISNENVKESERDVVQSVVEESLSDKKKRDYFKFTIPSHGIQFADHDDEGDESKGLTQSYREVLI